MKASMKIQSVEETGTLQNTEVWGPRRGWGETFYFFYFFAAFFKSVKFSLTKTRRHFCISVQCKNWIFHMPQCGSRKGYTWMDGTSWGREREKDRERTESPVREKWKSKKKAAKTQRRWAVTEDSERELGRQKKYAAVRQDHLCDDCFSSIGSVFHCGYN